MAELWSILMEFLMIFFFLQIFALLRRCAPYEKENATKNFSGLFTFHLHFLCCSGKILNSEEKAVSVRRKRKIKISFLFIANFSVLQWKSESLLQNFNKDDENEWILISKTREISVSKFRLSVNWTRKG